MHQRVERNHFQVNDYPEDGTPGYQGEFYTVQKVNYQFPGYEFHV